MIFHENRLLAILMKYHSLFLSKLEKKSQNLSSAVVEIGALRVKPTLIGIPVQCSPNGHKHLFPRSLW